MGFLSKAFKSVTKVVKKIAKSPFHAVRDIWRGVEQVGQGVGQLAQGDLGGAFKSAVGGVGSAAKGAIEGVSFGSVSDDGYLIDTSVKQASDSASKGVTDEASVSFAEAGSPSVIVGADEVEEDVLKRIKKQQQAGFLGGVSSSGASLLI